MTFGEIEQQWQQLATVELRRGFWEKLRGTPQGWLTACQAAVTGRDIQTIEQWLEAATKVEAGARMETSAGGKEACLRFANGVYAPVARAYLLCVQAILQTIPVETAAPVPESAIEGLAAQMPTLAWPLNQWRDVLYILRPSGPRAQALYSVTLPVVLVRHAPQQQVSGVVARLTLDLRPHGNGTLYPALPMAFVQRDPAFRTAEHNVWTYFRNAGVWLSIYDVCWELTDQDAKPLLSIDGGSLGAALALGLAKLFAMAGHHLCDHLNWLELQYLTLTATCATEGALEPVTDLETKLGAARTEQALHWLLVSTAQPDIERYLASTSEPPRVLTAATLQEAVHSLAAAQRPPNPFRRLLPFGVRDAPYFGGREEEIASVLSRVSETRFTALVGLSGSGKSSLAFAGVVPQLDPQQWLSARCHPLLAESGALAYAPELLSAPGSDGPQQEQEGPQGAEQSPDLRGEKSLAEHVARLLEGTSEKRLLLIIDQFEELFTVPTEDQQRVFLRQLATLVQGELSCCVLVTMRAEFYSKVLSAPLLEGIFVPHMMTLRSMQADQLMQAMQKPVAAVGLRFEPGLATRIAQELTEAQGALIFLELVLDELFEKRNGALLTHEVYRQMGEVRDAVARYATGVVSELATEEQRPQEEVETQLQEIFGKLVWNEDGTVAKATRYVAPLAEMDEHNMSMVDKLVNKGLLVKVPEGVQVSHEALIDYWPLMRKWVADHGTSLRFRATFLTWHRNQLSWPMLLVPCYAALVGGVTRTMFAQSFGTFMIDPASFEWWKAFAHGLGGTWLGSVLLIVWAAKVFFERPGALRIRTSALLAPPGLAWGVVFLVLLWNPGHERHAGWGYLLTGTCWGIGVAAGAYLGDKMRDRSADLSKSIRQRCVGAGVGTLGMLLAFVFIIGPALGAVLPALDAVLPWTLAKVHADAMARAWGEVCEQSVSVWAFLWFFARHLHKVYRGNQA